MHSIPVCNFLSGQHRYPVTAVGSVAEDNLRELGHVTLRFDGLSEAEFPGTVRGGPVPILISRQGSVLKFESVKGKMNQVAVVIGGGQTRRVLCHGLAAEGYRVAVVDIQERQSRKCGTRN